ncbi:transketolase family protein [Myceligenerans indicum]|uniref:Transketolase n=1 Tax=Myceligenerans indicum TaxID=2593663 RepID=A0ABS1LMY0_9MICO|nr:transketolase [Myceligenerans indicum]MBL0887148.1 transketolase [Myceligenerans indicum]
MSTAAPLAPSPRAQFGRTSCALLDEREDLAVVWAEISGQYLEAGARAHPDRVINVGIREQLLVSLGAGLALNGVRPIMHTFAPFLVERAFEQIKLDFAHQGVGGVLVSAGGSFDKASSGRTHQGPADVALAATVPGMTVHAPGTAAEVDATIRAAVAGDGLHYVRTSELTQATRIPTDGAMHVLHEGRGPGRRSAPAGGPLTLLALGPVRDAALAAARELDATLLTTTSVVPLDGQALRAHAGGEVVVIEPWLEGTSVAAVAAELDDAPRRFLGIGTSHQELRRYGTPAEHVTAHGLDPDGLIRRIRAWSRSS